MYLQKVISKKTKIAGSGVGSVRKRYGSADPDPYQNITAGTFVLVSSLVVCNATAVGGKKDGGVAFLQLFLSDKNSLQKYKLTLGLQNPLN